MCGPDLEENTSQEDKKEANPMSGTVNDVIVPFITTDQMREVDRAMIEDFGISLVQMMENAGRNLAQLARQRFLDGDPRGRRVVVLAGTGGNGGGGLVCARRLHNWGAEVEVSHSEGTSNLACNSQNGFNGCCIPGNGFCGGLLRSFSIGRDP